VNGPFVGKLYHLGHKSRVCKQVNNHIIAKSFDLTTLKIFLKGSGQLSFQYFSQEIMFKDVFAVKWRKVEQNATN
jgi:hypothetical protein